LDLQDLSSKLVTRVHCQALKRGYERVYVGQIAFKLKHVGQYDKILLTSQTLLVSKEAENTYKWIHWIITENRELDFCEKDRVQIHTKGNLDKVSTETLKIQMGAVVEVMEKDLAWKLPNKFGVAFDGWSEDGVHHLAVFAAGDFVPNEECVLL
jgi:hypothetical protein